MADFRTDDIRFDVIMKTVGNMISKLQLTDRIPIVNSWDRLREEMENMSRGRTAVKKMNLNEFPKINDIEDLPPLMDDLLESLDEHQIIGHLCDEAVEEGRAEEICPGVDVVIYTKSKIKRPWVGRVHEMLPGDKFMIQWYIREGRRKKFNAMINPDGTPATEEISLDRDELLMTISFLSAFNFSDRMGILF